MGNLIKTPKIEIRTEEGQCDIHITLDLNINLNGGITTSKDVKIDEEDKVQFEIPVFKSDEKLKFGKRVE